MGHLIQAIFMMLGGTTRWIHANFMNIVFSKENESHIGHYLYENDKSVNRSGMDSVKLNFVVGIVVFVLIITIIGYFN